MPMPMPMTLRVIRPGSGAQYGFLVETGSNAKMRSDGTTRHLIAQNASTPSNQGPEKLAGSGVLAITGTDS
jgi:hypothetical protein